MNTSKIRAHQHTPFKELILYLEEFLVVVGRGPLEFSLEGVHDDKMIAEGLLDGCVLFEVLLQIAEVNVSTQLSIFRFVCLILCRFYIKAGFDRC